MKVALYARVSSERQDVNLSISSQLKALREYAWKNGYSIVQEFVDEAESGRSASQETPILSTVWQKSEWDHEATATASAPKNTAH